MRRLRALVVFVPVMTLIPIVRLWAQASDSVVFRRGQSGAEFNISNGFFGAGLLRFRSPTRALVLSLSGDYHTTSISDPSGSGTGRSSQVNLSLGLRRYHQFAPRLYRTFTLGIQGSYTYQRNEFASTSSTGGGFGEGVFANLGAEWLVTPHLAMGASWGVSAGYSRLKTTSGSPPASATSSQYSIDLNGIRLVGQLYF